jgi:diguanylate cyclase (GGDEF)-like protein/PAS domain S-box-containing protein
MTRILSLILLAAIGTILGWFVLRRVRDRDANARGGPDHAQARRDAIAERLASIGSWTLHLRDNSLRWSEGAYRIFGWDPQAGEPGARQFIEMIDPPHRERWRKALRAAVRDARALKMEFRLRRPDGQIVWIRMALRPERSRDRVVRMSGIVQDVTRVMSAQKQLAASEARFRDLTELSSDWVWESDAEHRFTVLSAGTDLTIGPWYRDMIGKRPWDAPEFDLSEGAWEGYRTLVESHRPVTDHEFSLIGPDGQIHHLEINGKALLDAQGGFIGYRGTGRDITRERQQRTLLEIEGELAQIMRDSAGAERMIRQVVGTLCRHLGLLGGFWLGRTDGGVAVRLCEGPPGLCESQHDLSGLAAIPADAPEARAIESGRHAWLIDPDSVRALADRYQVAPGMARCALVLPIADEHGESDSMLLVFGPRAFRGEGLIAPVAETLSRILSLFLRRARAEQRLLHASMHDTLTSLPNRANLLKTLEQRLRSGESLALLYIDLDRYKLINDTVGHEAGDRALIEIARRLKSRIGRHDMAARMGGDEFVVLLAGPQAPDVIERTARSILTEIEKPIMLAERAWFLSASIGIALAPDDAADLETLIRCADSAMYEVKTSGRNDVRFFSGTLSDTRAEQLELAAELPRALQYGELEHFYQPVLAIGSRQVVCIEALLRWRHPTRGILLPEKFLPAAEQSQLIREIGIWALRRALDDRVKLGIERFPTMAVSVNVSARQLVDEEFVVALRRLLEERRLPATLLRIELTESAFVAHPERTAELIDNLRSLGVRVIIDNFGTGYASLSYLKNLPVDGLKIDRAFVEGLPDDRGNAAIVQAVTAMAARLGLQAMAEGVETAAELRGLRALNCDQVQGSLIAEPMPLDEVEGFLEALPAIRTMHLAAGNKASA